MEYIINTLTLLGLNDKIDFAVVLIYFLGGMIAKNVGGKLSVTYKTLLIGSMLSIVYVLFRHLDGHVINFASVFLSYTLSTSLYELVIKKIKDRFVKKVNEESYICNCLDLTFYKAEELEPSEIDAIIETNSIDSDTIYYSNNHIYVPIINDDGSIELQSNYVGTRPPQKAVRR